MFFAPRRGKKPYRQIGVNPSGKYFALAYDETPPPSIWDSGVKIHSDIQTDRWTASLAFPLAALLPEGTQAGKSFHANFYRGSPSTKTMLAWSPNFESNFHVLTRLGKVTLS